MHVCVYIYIYACLSSICRRVCELYVQLAHGLRLKVAEIRPISLLRLSLLRLLDSTFPRIPLMDMRIPPRNIKILLESNSPKSRISVRIGRRCMP